MQQEPAPGHRRDASAHSCVGQLRSTHDHRAGTLGQAEARRERFEDGLEVASVSEFRSPDYPADAVVAQDPAPASRAPRVSMLLNRGEQATTYVMPDLIGTNGERAAETLRTRGFRVTIVGSQPYQGVPPGTVVRQQPPGGFRVGPADGISLEVSQ